MYIIIIGLRAKMCRHCRHRVCHAYVNAYVNIHNMTCLTSGMSLERQHGGKKNGGILGHIFVKNGQI